MLVHDESSTGATRFWHVSLKKAASERSLLLWATPFIETILFQFFGFNLILNSLKASGFGPAFAVPAAVFITAAFFSMAHLAVARLSGDKELKRGDAQRWFIESIIFSIPIAAASFYSSPRASGCRDYCVVTLHSKFNELVVNGRLPDGFQFASILKPLIEWRELDELQLAPPDGKTAVAIGSTKKIIEGDNSNRDYGIIIRAGKGERLEWVFQAVSDGIGKSTGARYALATFSKLFLGSLKKENRPRGFWNGLGRFFRQRFPLLFGAANPELTEGELINRAKKAATMVNQTLLLEESTLGGDLGTTFSALFLLFLIKKDGTKEKRVLVLSFGDSPIYSYLPGRGVKLINTLDNAEHSSSVLTNGIGTTNFKIKADNVFTMKITPGEIFTIGSDGIASSYEELAQIHLDDKDADARVRKIVEKSIEIRSDESRHNDDITAASVNELGRINFSVAESDEVNEESNVLVVYREKKGEADYSSKGFYKNGLDLLNGGIIIEGAKLKLRVKKTGMPITFYRMK